MPKFTDYTEKQIPEDNDSLMLYDAAANVNKHVLFSGFWKWVAKKLKEATLSDLQTTDKTIIGALNELNGKSESYICSPGKNFEKALQNNKIVLVFISPLENSNIRSTGATIVATRGSNDYSGKCTEISPINSAVTLSLDGSNLKVNSTIWIRINITVL